MWQCRESKSQSCCICNHSEGQISPPVSHVLCDLKKGDLNPGGPFCCSFYGVLLQQVREKLLCRNFCTQFSMLIFLSNILSAYANIALLIFGVGVGCFYFSFIHSLIHSFIHLCPCCWQLSPALHLRQVL